MAKQNPLEPPSTGAAISRRGGELVVPDNPIIPFIEGDGTGPDIWRASVRVLDAAVHKAYGGQKKSRGWKCLRAKRASSSSITGCPTKPSTRSVHISSASRVR